MAKISQKLGILAAIIIVAVGIFFIEKPKDNDSPIVLQAAYAATADSLEFTWTANNDDTKLYRLYHGINSGQYGEVLETTDNSNHILVNTANFAESEHYFAVSAVDAAGNESPKSTELIINLDPASKACGNGIVEKDLGEVCDGNAKFCENGYRGEQTCNSNCDAWTHSCNLIEYCGDGTVNGNEECEGKTTNIACTDGIYYGTASCAKCHLTECNTGSQACGNGILEGGEVCRDNNKFSEPCLWNNIYPGYRSCDNSTCLWDSTLGCVKNSACPDGYKDNGEDCDTNDFGNNSIACSDWGHYNKGIVSCNNTCVVNISNCSLCGDGVVTGSETCDGNNYINNKDACSDWGFSSGTLSCNGCQIDYSGCQYFIE